MYNGRKQRVPAKSKKVNVICEVKICLKKDVFGTKVKQNCISIQGVNLWNVLTDNLKSVNATFQFKKMFKSKLYQKHESDCWLIL